MLVIYTYTFERACHACCLCVCVMHECADIEVSNMMRLEFDQVGAEDDLGVVRFRCVFAFHNLRFWEV